MYYGNTFTWFIRPFESAPQEKGLKQVEMAAFLECTEGHYQKIEYGKINLPTLTLIKLADFFDVTTDYLLGRTENRAVNR